MRTMSLSRIGLALIVVGMLPFHSSTANAQQNPSSAHRYLLTSSRTNLRTDSFELTHRDLGLSEESPWSIRKTTLHGGKQEGAELITVDNGRLVVTVIPTRGMSVYEVRQGEMRLGWDSPIQEIVHPQFINLESRGGLGWIEGFNEWLVRCGLEYAGHPGRDRFIDNTGAEAEMNLTLHGKIGNIPASEVEVLIDREPPHRLRVRGLVHERTFFGPKLELLAEISTLPGSDTFRIDDTVTNRGSASQEFQLIYHVNYGRPLLEAGARIVAPIATLTPMNDHAARAISHFDKYAGPQAGFVEEVFLMHPYADSDGQTVALLHNEAGDRGASIRWSTAELPFLTVWKNTAAEEDGYVTGLEPGTGFPFNRRVERQQGRLAVLESKESRRFSLEFGLHRGKDSVDQVRQQIESIQADRPTHIETEPPQIEE